MKQFLEIEGIKIPVVLPSPFSDEPLSRNPITVNFKFEFKVHQKGLDEETIEEVNEFIKYYLNEMMKRFNEEFNR